MAQRPRQPLTGEALAQRVRELAHLSRTETAKACGYYTRTKDGRERANLQRFLNALLDAEGIDPDSRSSSQAAPGRGREPRYRVRVQSNGTLVLSSGYSKLMGLQPGDTFQLEPGRKHLRLRYLGHADEQKGDK